MAQNADSGRIVVDINPNLKRRLYANLSLSGSTLKDWFRKNAEEYCEGKTSPTVSAKVRFPANGEGGAMVMREEYDSPPVVHGHANGKSKLTKKHKVVSMFSGCGGMDLGFRGGFESLGRIYPELPYEIVWANDLNPAACKTYERNLGSEIHRGNVWDLIDTMPKSADVVIGGFPCQDISVNGKRAGVNGPKSGLYKAMVEAINRLKPKVFVAENVKALMRNKEWLHQVLGDFRGLGYELHYQVYQAADYGVPQTRERVLIVGTAEGVRTFVPPVSERNAATWITAQEAIGDLEEFAESPKFNHIWSQANTSPEQGNRKLIANRPGYTIRAECHGNIQYHYRLPRRVSMREAARIQSFPDKFLFVSGLRETERQVGNAVPPVLAWHMANAVLASLR